MAEVLHFPQTGLGPAAPPTVAAGPGDAEARQAALDPTRSFLVEAPAGSGKTGLLIQRFLRLLSAENVEEPGAVLAITFTRKATVEMRDRVLAQLKAASDGVEGANAFDRQTRALAEAVLRRDRELGWGLLSYPRRLNIRTIDSVCGEIARTLPVLAGGASLQPAADPEPLYREAAERTLMRLGDPRYPVLSRDLGTLMLHRDGNLGNCRALIAQMLGFRDQWGQLMPIRSDELSDEFLDREVRGRMKRALDHAICRVLTRLVAAVPASFLSELSRLATEWAALDGVDGQVSPIRICASLGREPLAEAAHLEHWQALLHLLLTQDGSFRKPLGLSKSTLGFIMQRHHRDELRGLLEQVREDEALREALCAARCLPPADYPEEEWVVSRALFRILAHALAELQVVFTEGAVCDFIEPALQARFALAQLAGPPAAGQDVEDAEDAEGALASGTRLQHLLVDEMQDTSTTQYELIRLLTQGWDGCSQTVFLVGDPKQSIYLFREARVERFVATMLAQKLGDVALTVLRLRANFRSEARLVGDFNADFTRMFPAAADPSHPEQVPYLEAEAARPATGTLSGAGGRTWHAAVVPVTGDKAGAQRQVRRRQAEQLRDLVVGWLARPLPEGRARPWRVAVLVRSRNHLQDVVAALKREPAVPFRAVDIEPLGERQEILDLLALTRALLHPADRTAGLALLRTPWCGLTLADLHRLAGAEERAEDPAENSAEGQAEERTKEQAEKQAANRIKEQSPNRDRTLHELLVSRGDLLSADGLQRLEQFFPVYDQALRQRGQLPLARWVERTWCAFGADRFATAEERSNVDRFLDLVAELERPGPTLDLDALTRKLSRLFAADSGAPAQLELMTIHAAKGLEWDFVAVPALDRISLAGQWRLLSWLEVDPGKEFADPGIAHGILAPIAGKGQKAQALSKWMRSVDAEREAAERKRLFYVAATRAREELHLFAAPSRKADGTLSVPANTLLHAAWPAVEDVFEALDRSSSRSISGTSNGFVNDRPQAELLAWPGGGDGLALAAGADDSGADVAGARTILRIPAVLPERTPASLPCAAGPAVGFTAPFARPEGSYGARVFGNTVHAVLEQVTRELAAGATLEELHGRAAEWLPRIVALLRSAGLAPAELGTGRPDLPAARVLLALRNTLADPMGRWVVGPHPGAATEQSFTAAGLTLRPDRVFLAGEAAGSAGQSHLWIVDYKTATAGGREVTGFLEREKTKYTPQLVSYGHALEGSGRPVRLALFYPMVPALVEV